MKWISNINNTSSWIFFLVVAFLGVKIPLMIIDMKYLPDTTKSVIVDETEYYNRFDFLNGLDLRIVLKVESNITKKPKIVSRDISQKRQQPSLYDIKKIKLRSIYIENKNSFVAFIDDNELQLIGLDEIYKGYTLDEVTKEYVVFSSDKSYQLFLEDQKKVIASKSRVVRKSTSPKLTNVTISKNDINQYLNGSRDVLRDISFIPYKENGKLIGYKIKRIRISSPLASLGLKKGDIVIEVNGKSMSKMSNLMYFYSKRDTLDRLNIIYLRNGNEQELNYEIR